MLSAKRGTFYIFSFFTYLMPLCTQVPYVLYVRLSALTIWIIKFQEMLHKNYSFKLFASETYFV